MTADGLWKGSCKGLTDNNICLKEGHQWWRYQKKALRSCHDSESTVWICRSAAIEGILAANPLGEHWNVQNNLGYELKSLDFSPVGMDHPWAWKRCLLSESCLKFNCWLIWWLSSNIKWVQSLLIFKSYMYNKVEFILITINLVPL